MQTKEQIREILRSLNAYSLPNNPSDSNWSSERIKAKLYDGEDYLLDIVFDSKEDLKIALEQGLVIVEKAKEDELGNNIKDIYETKDNVTLKLAQTLSSAKEYADTKKAEAIASANSYADTKDTATLNSAKAYANSQDSATLATAQSYANSKKTEAISSANSYTDGEIANLKNESEDYTDGKIDYLKDYTDDNKVDFSDVVNNLTDTSTIKPLSANQGRILLGMIVAIQQILESPDTDLDTLREIVVYVKSHQSLIESITTSKVSVSDIIDNLTSQVTNKPLSANQGYVLKGLIDLRLAISDIYDGLDSTSTVKALSANMGRELDEKKANVEDVYDKNETMSSEEIEQAILESSHISFFESYSSDNTYNEGTYIVHNAVIYRAEEDGITGTWDASKWSICTITDLSKEVSEKATKSDLSGKENTSNKVTSLSSSSTDTQYPSAKAVYDLVGTLDNKGADVQSFDLVNPVVKDFVNYVIANPYNDNDYTYSYVTGVKESDFNNQFYSMEKPLPVKIKWEHNQNAVKTVLIYGLNSLLEGASGFRRIDVTNLNEYAIYNLVPNTTYYYKVQSLNQDGITVILKQGSFTTTNNQCRMLDIEGLYNVRDIGGYVGLDNCKVKYGLLFRGSTGNESSAKTNLYPNTVISGKGKLELLDVVGVKAELDLRGGSYESFIGNEVKYLNIAFSNYEDVITNATQKGYVKQIIEKLIEWFSATKPYPVYFHCQGGFDRTGTLATIILGVLGVSESNLSLEYELSSFSRLGIKGRIRSSTSYHYKETISAIKTYAGTTLADKLVNYLKDCGLTENQITQFRVLMLEGYSPDTNLFVLNRSTPITAVSGGYITDYLNEDYIINSWKATTGTPARTEDDSKATYNISGNSITVNQVTSGYEIAFPIRVESGKKYKITYTQSSQTYRRAHYRFYDSVNDTWSDPNISMPPDAILDNSNTTYDWLIIGFGSSAGNSVTISNIRLEESNE